MQIFPKIALFKHHRYSIKCKFNILYNTHDICWIGRLRWTNHTSNSIFLFNVKSFNIYILLSYFQCNDINNFRKIFLSNKS